MAATSHMWILSTWNMACVTEKLNFYLTFKLRFKKQPTQLRSIAFQQGCHGNSIGKDAFSTSGAETNWISIYKRMKLTLTHNTKINSKWIKDKNVTAKSLLNRTKV